MSRKCRGRLRRRPMDVPVHIRLRVKWITEELVRPESFNAGWRGEPLGSPVVYRERHRLRDLGSEEGLQLIEDCLAIDRWLTRSERRCEPEEGSRRTVCSAHIVDFTHRPRMAHAGAGKASLAPERRRVLGHDLGHAAHQHRRCSCESGCPLCERWLEVYG